MCGTRVPAPRTAAPLNAPQVPPQVPPFGPAVPPLDPLPDAPAAATPATRVRRARADRVSYAAWVAGGGLLTALACAQVMGASYTPARGGGDPWAHDFVRIAAMYGTAFGLLWAAVAVHEFGHAAAGVAAGLRCDLFAVGWVRWERTSPAGRLCGGRLRFGRPPVRAWGYVVCPPRGDGGAGGVRHARRARLMIAAGPLAGALFAAAAGTAWFALPAGTAGRTCAAAAVLAGVTCVDALVPRRPRDGGPPSDGEQLRTLRRGPAAARAAAVLTFIAQARAGVRPRDWDAAAVAAASAVRDGSADEYVARHFAGTHHLDAALADPARWADARDTYARLAELWDVIPPASRPTVAVDAAWIEAGARGDADRGRAWLEPAAAAVAGGPPEFVADWCCAVAAVRSAAGEFDAARDAREQAALWLDAAPPTAGTAALSDALAALRHAGTAAA